jgi:hypothetical protein
MIWRGFLAANGDLERRHQERWLTAAASSPFTAYKLHDNQGGNHYNGQQLSLVKKSPRRDTPRRNGGPRDGSAEHILPDFEYGSLHPY